MKFLNDFEELESLLNLRQTLLFCRDRNGLHTKALNSIDFGLPSVSALMDEGLAWKRIKEEALEEISLWQELQKKPGRQVVDEIITSLRRQEEELRRSYEKSLKEKLATIRHLERLIQTSIHEAAIESFRRRHLEKLHRNLDFGSTAVERRVTPDDCLQVPMKWRNADLEKPQGNE